jgi:hypothetical protein
VHRRDVNVRLGEPLCDVGNGARPVFAVGEKPALLSAQLEPGGSGRLHERGAVFRDEVQLGPACAVRERGDTDQVDARIAQGGQDTRALAGLIRHARVIVVDSLDFVGHRRVLSMTTLRLAQIRVQEGGVRKAQARARLEQVYTRIGKKVYSRA